MPVDVARLRKECVYESQAPLPNLVADLDEVGRVANLWRAARKRLITAGVLLLIATLPFLAILGPAGLVLAPVGIYLMFRAKSYPKLVVHNLSRCAFLRSVALMLAGDSDPQKPVKVRLSFATTQNLIGESALQHRRNGKQKLYRTPWLSLQVQLLDGTSFCETVDELVRLRTYTNTRGKSKSKTRKRSLLAMRFAYDPEVYGNATRLGAALHKEVKLPQSASFRGGVIGEKAVKVKAVAAEGEELVQTNTMLALGVYRVLNLSRKLAARAHRQGGAR